VIVKLFVDRIVVASSFCELPFQPSYSLRKYTRFLLLLLKLVAGGLQLIALIL
jgi:hypothetical protein